MAVFDAKSYEHDTLHYLRKRITFSDTGTTSLGWLPEGAIVVDAFAIVSTAFNSATSDLLSLGYRNAPGLTDDTDEWMTVASIAAAGKVVADEIDASVGVLLLPGGGEAVCVYASSGAAPTAGVADVHIIYTVDNTDG